MSDAGECHFGSLSSDLTSLILSLLPVPSLVRASAVCKLWHSLISDPSFGGGGGGNRPWFFLCGLHNTSSKNHQSFAFDPLSDSWFRLPLPSSPLDPSSAFAAASGFLFATAPNFTCTQILNRSWRLTPPLHFPRINPLLGVFPSSSAAAAGFVVVGGVRFIGGLVDIEDRLAVEIYDPQSNCWDLCPPLPADFRSGNSSQSLSSALFRDRFYVLGIYSSFVSSFDLRNHVWSNVQTLRPPGVLFSFLIACQDQIVLAGLCNTTRGPSFNLWSIHDQTMEFSEIAIMPQDLLYSLVDIDSDEDDIFASLKCVGSGRIVYVFNEEYHKKYPACVCEIGSESDGDCRWRRVPGLPSPVNKFHKVISFCSSVTLDNVLRRD